VTVNTTRGLREVVDGWSRRVGPSRNSTALNHLPLNCDAGQLLSPYDYNFCQQLEDGIRTLVLLMGDRLRCLTYSSCEGHLAGEMITPAHVGIVVQDDHELTQLVSCLSVLLERAPGAIVPRLLEGKINDPSGSLSCLDLVFHGSGITGSVYIESVKLSIAKLIRRLIVLPPGNEFLPAARLLGARQPGMQLKRAPYPWHHLRRLFEPADVDRILQAVSVLAMRRVVRSGYSLAVAGLSELDSGLARTFAGTIAFITGRIAAIGKLHLDSLELHEMAADDLVSIHTDQPTPGLDMWRLVLYLDDVPQESGGTHLILARKGKSFRICNSIQPKAGDALIFAMSDESFHAVAPIAAGTLRRTIVATYRR
jgi:hypothetical protein